jgi:hypothetical protein
VPSPKAGFNCQQREVIMDNRDSDNGAEGSIPEIPRELEQAVRVEMERRARILEAVNHFYSGTYQALNTNTYEVVQVGWKGCNDMTPLVLLSRGKRTELGIEVGEIVKISLGDKSLPAIVDRQFKDMYAGITVNKLVSHVLGCKVKTDTELGSLVTVSTLV